nr:hypothetical protein CFP56_00290 [Quercus suber]
MAQGMHDSGIAKYLSQTSVSPQPTERVLCAGMSLRRRMVERYRSELLQMGSSPMVLLDGEAYAKPNPAMAVSGDEASALLSTIDQYLHLIFVAACSISCLLQADCPSVTACLEQDKRKQDATDVCKTSHLTDIRALEGSQQSLHHVVVSCASGQQKHPPLCT